MAIEENQESEEAAGPVLEDDEDPGPPVRSLFGPAHVAVCVMLAGMLLYYNFIGLWPSDVWSHIAYGRWILEHHALPEREPFLPLAAGERLVHYAWLGQVLLAVTERVGGAKGLSNLFALMVMMRYAVLCRAYHLVTRRLWLAIGGTLLVLGMCWGRSGIIRPEIFSALALNLLLLILAAIDPAYRPPEEPEPEAASVDRPFPLWAWLAVPAIFAAWVNLHASVYVGLAILAAHALGRALEMAPVLPIGAWFSRVRLDPAFRRWVGLAVVATVATFLHPEGPRILIDTLRMARHPNMKSVTEWHSLTTNGLEGRLYILSFGLIAAIWRWSPRRVRPVEALLLAGFGAGPALSARLSLWYAPVFAYALLPHAAALLDRYWPARPAVGAIREPLRSYLCGVLCLLALWAGFVFSYLSDAVFGQRPRSVASLYGKTTPIALADYLVAHPPSGQLWNSQFLGDWIGWTMLNRTPPPALPLNLFINTQMHIMPPAIFQDYTAIGFLRPGWRQLLDKYRVTTMAVSKIQHAVLISEMRELPGWDVVFEDDTGIVATRVAELKKEAGHKPDTP